MGGGQLVWSPSPAAEPFSRREARAEGAVSGEYVHPARMCLSVLGLLSDEHPPYLQLQLGLAGSL